MSDASRYARGSTKCNARMQLQASSPEGAECSLFCTRDLMEDSFVPKDVKIPKVKGVPPAAPELWEQVMHCPLPFDSVLGRRMSGLKTP